MNRVFIDGRYLPPVIDVEEMAVENGYSLSVGGEHEDMGNLEEL